jgi:hypothetical protein
LLKNRGLKEDQAIQNFGKGVKPMTHDEFIAKSKELVAAYTNGNTDKSDDDKRLINPEDVYVVWSVKVLQNSKALLSTPLFDGMYYEVTLNGSKDEVYFDAYKKWANIKVEV